MIALVCRHELEKQYGQVTPQEWNHAIESFGEVLNNSDYTPQKEEQLNTLSTLIDDYRRKS